MVYKNNILTHTRRNVLKIGTLLVCLFACVGTYAQDTVRAKSKWMDDYPKHVGLTYTVGMDAMSNYIWRGLYVAGLSAQPDLAVGYGGVYLDVWGSLSATDWTFQQINSALNCAFAPEIDVTLGFSRWGLDIKFMHMYYFDRYKNGAWTKYFDFGDPYDGQGGITQEWRIKYRISNKLPLHVMFCTRTFGRDGYPVNERIEDGKTVWDRKRAYSSYIEVGYEFALPYQMTLYTNLGMTPWKSFYTKYQGDFAVVDFDVKLQRSWDVSKHCLINVCGQLMLNPYDISRMAQRTYNTISDGKADTYIPINGGRQVLWNVGLGVYLK